MLIALWIVNGVLAALFLMAGITKLTRPVPKLSEMGMTWVDAYSPGFVRFIGAVEVIGPFGLILPLATGIAPVLTPLAAVGLAIIMIGAVVFHLRRREPWLPSGVLLALSLASAVLGFLVVFG